MMDPKNPNLLNTPLTLVYLMKQLSTKLEGGGKFKLTFFSWMIEIGSKLFVLGNLHIRCVVIGCVGEGDIVRSLFIDVL